MGLNCCLERVTNVWRNKKMKNKWREHMEKPQKISKAAKQRITSYTEARKHEVSDQYGMSNACVKCKDGVYRQAGGML